MTGTLAIIEDDGGTHLKVWVRRSPRNFNEDAPDFKIKGLNAKMVALAMLKRYPAKILYVKSRRRVKLLAAVKARKSTCKALEMLSKADRITKKQAQRMMENPAPTFILKHLKRTRIG